MWSGSPSLPLEECYPMNQNHHGHGQGRGLVGRTPRSYGVSRTGTPCTRGIPAGCCYCWDLPWSGKGEESDRCRGPEKGFSPGERGQPSFWGSQGWHSSVTWWVSQGCQTIVTYWGSHGWQTCWEVNDATPEPPARGEPTVPAHLPPQGKLLHWQWCLHLLRENLKLSYCMREDTGGYKL